MNPQKCKCTKYLMPYQVINTLNKWGENSKKMAYGANLEFENRTTEKNWDTKDDLDCQIKTDNIIHPELSADFPGVLLEEDIPDNVAAVDTETLEPNSIAASADANSGIKNTTGVYYDSAAPTPLLSTVTNPIVSSINPTPDTEPDDEHAYIKDDNKDNDDGDGEVEEVEPPEEDTPYPIKIESDNEDKN